MTIQRIVGQVQRVNGPVIEAVGITDAMIFELVKVGDEKLIGEIVKLEHDTAIIQVYEDTVGIAPGYPVYGDNMPLSIELGPGLLGGIYDGIQRPLEKIRDRCGIYISRGINIPALDKEKLWKFTPSCTVGDTVEGGMIIGSVQETDQLVHRILVPPDVKGIITHVVETGEYTVDDEIATVTSGEIKHTLTLMHRWPIRRARPVRRRLPLEIPLITGQRVIDTLFPAAKGGTVAIPGGFGTGKTMTQQAVAKWCDADIIIYIGCGERGNEITDVLREFPGILDPRTGRSLMERTILIANTSNMPVSAREASIYTGITMAEYYRDMGLHVAVMADSTSRWAEALRELSGRMEEMPAEEGFPAYLPTRIAEFYERAGYMQTCSGHDGSVTIIGAVSPPGGDFSEPVTQHTKRFIRCFWGLDRQLANARHYPAISWIDSYSEYFNDIAAWWDKNVSSSWHKERATIMDLLQREMKLQQVVKLVGPDALPDSQRFIIEICTMFKNGFLQQNAFDPVDMFSSVDKQARMLHIIMTFFSRGTEAIKVGIPLVSLKKMKIYQDIIKMKFTIPDSSLSDFDKLSRDVALAFDKIIIASGKKGGVA